MKFLEVFSTALKLGLTSFGGPIAHLSYFRDEYVEKKKWIGEKAYADLVVLCQFLPGPASSQVGMAVGFHRAGIFGALLSWIGFTLPSAVILILFGLGITNVNGVLNQNWLHGLKVIAVAVVAQAVWGMGKKLCPDKKTITIATISGAIILFFTSGSIQFLVLGGAGLFGAFFLSAAAELPHEPLHKGRKRTGFIFIALFFILLIILPMLRGVNASQGLQLFDSFYRTGSLVFGGGHVVLPLLRSEVVPAGWITNDLFMAGYGIANAIPGPLFAFSGYLGAVSSSSPNGWLGALLCLVATFLPSFLLIVGILPFWEKLRAISKIRQAMRGLNAAVVGILVAALYDPVWISAIYSSKDFAMVVVGFVMLEFWKLPSWSVVLIAAVASHYI